MSEEESRAAFENWFWQTYKFSPKVYVGDHPFKGEYIAERSRFAWAVWQAAIEWAGEE